MNVVEPNLVKIKSNCKESNEQLPKMRSTRYFAEITNKKAENYLPETGKTRIHLLAHLLASCQLRNFPREFTENIFAVFDQSSRLIYLTWYRSLLFFPEFTSVIPFMV